MTMELLKQIRECEEQAEHIRHEGFAESRRIVEKASSDSTFLTSQSQIETDTLYKDTIAKTKTDAQLDYNKTIEHVKWECEMILKSARKHYNDAIEIIIDMVTK